MLAQLPRLLIALCLGALASTSAADQSRERDGADRMLLNKIAGRAHNTDPRNVVPICTAKMWKKDNQTAKMIYKVEEEGLPNSDHGGALLEKFIATLSRSVENNDLNRKWSLLCEHIKDQKNCIKERLGNERNVQLLDKLPERTKSIAHADVLCEHEDVMIEGLPLIATCAVSAFYSKEWRICLDILRNAEFSTLCSALDSMENCTQGVLYEKCAPHNQAATTAIIAVNSNSTTNVTNDTSFNLTTTTPLTTTPSANGLYLPIKELAEALKAYRARLIEMGTNVLELEITLTKCMNDTKPIRDCIFRRVKNFDNATLEAAQNLFDKDCSTTFQDFQSLIRKVSNPLISEEKASPSKSRYANVAAKLNIRSNFIICMFIALFAIRIN